MKPCPNSASIAKFLATQLTTALRPLKLRSLAPREIRTLSNMEVLMIVFKPSMEKFYVEWKREKCASGAIFEPDAS
jgi:hypothetical protein